MSCPMTSSIPFTSTLSVNASPFSPRSALAAKYIPVHRRASSYGSESPIASSSSLRPSSPTPMEVDMPTPSEPTTPTPGVYSFEALLALRPMADESIKGKMRETCPQVLMNHRMKKSVQYLSTHPQVLAKLHQNKQHKRYEQQTKEKSKSSSTTTPIVSVMPLAFKSTTRQRSMPRRNRSGRGSDRRRGALQDTWQGMRITARQPLMVV